MKSGYISYFGSYRSQSPICSTSENKKNNFNKLYNNSIRILNTSSNSYKKLQKNYMIETSLTYIHKLKESELKNINKKTITQKTDKMNISSYTSKESCIKICESPQRNAPIILYTSCSETSNLPKSINEQRILYSKEYNYPRYGGTLSFPDIFPQNGSTKAASFFENSNKLYIKDSCNKIRGKALTQDKIYKQIQKLHELKLSFKRDKRKNKTKAIQTTKEADISAWEY